MNAISQDDKLNLVQKLCDLLDSIDYFTNSNSNASNYLEYVNGEYPDERRLIEPVFFPLFATEILGFSIGSTLIPQKSIHETLDKPDYMPKDIRAHPFLFELKGTNSRNLSTPIILEQIQSYVQAMGVEYGVLLNLRDIQVYENRIPLPRSDLSFSIEKLYLDYKNSPKSILSQKNTKQFFRFLSVFSFRQLDFAQKVSAIAQSKEWTGYETLSLDELVETIRGVVELLHRDTLDRKRTILEVARFNEERRQKIFEEIEAIAISFEGKKPEWENTYVQIQALLNAKEGSLEERATSLFLYRVAYFTMTRILLVRLWEDIGLIDESLYDGGFNKWYNNFDREIDRVLKYAFNLAGEKYSWLFRKENNYTWYYPSGNVLIDVLYDFSHYNFAKLNADALGTIYEEYVDKADRKNKGQYYTPKEIISFIWDLVGFTDDEAFFRYEKGIRHPKLVFDPCTGSGGFLVEAARRLREESNYDKKDPRSLREIEYCIIQGLYGCEISSFAYYITEVNLLIQLTPVIRDLLDFYKRVYKHPEFALSVINEDALSLHNPRQKVLAGVETFFNGKEEGKRNGYDIIVPEGQKRIAYNFIVNNQCFDYVCANPPYIGEKGHKELFRSTVKRFPYWEAYYQGKMDYLYWFIMLGLSKLREGGKLGFITTSYWPTADGAKKLKKEILSNAKILTMIDFGETKIFEGAPGQHNMIFVLEKCQNVTERANNKIKICRVRSSPEGKNVSEKLSKLLSHIKKGVNKKSFSSEYVEIFVSPYKQQVLTEDSWSIFVQSDSSKILTKIELVGNILKSNWTVNQGVVPNPLRLTKTKYEQLSSKELSEYKLKINDGVFVLTESEIHFLNLNKQEKEDVIKPYFKNSDVEQFITANKTPFYLIYVTPETKISDYPNVYQHLSKFKTLLLSRRECLARKIPWFSLHWARTKNIFEDAKIVCSYRAETPSFAYHYGSFYGSTDMYFIKPKSANEHHSPLYLTAILNSSLIEFWLSQKGKSKGKATEQFTTPIENIPVRLIDFNNKKEIKLHDKLVALVESIIKHKKELLEYNGFFSNNRLTRLPNSVPLPDIDLEALTRSLPSTKIRTIRTHPKTTCDPSGIKEFFLKKFIQSSSETLDLLSKNKQKIFIIAPKEIVKYLASVLPKYTEKSWEEIMDIVVPVDWHSFEVKKDEIISAVHTLRRSIDAEQLEIDTIVYRLYGLTGDEIKTIEENLAE